MNNEISTEMLLDSDATTFADGHLVFNVATDISESTSEISVSTEPDVEIYDDGFYLIGGKHFISKYPGTAVPYLTIAFTASIVGTLGNIAVLFIIFAYKPLKNARNAFLVNLAMADLLVTAVANPFGIIGIMEGKPFFDKRPMLCDAVATICLMACVTALFSIGGISFNRYLHICHPSVYSRVFNLKVNILLCISFWFVGIGMSLPGLVGWTDNVYDHKMLECIWNRTHSLSYTIFFSACVVFTPVAIISFSYIKIYNKFIKSKQALADKKDEQSKNKAASIKLARTLFAIFIVFVACWTPYAILVLIDFNDRFPLEVHLYILLLAHMHSTLNPIVYGLTNVHFQQGYRIIFSILTCGKFGHDNKISPTMSAANTNTQLMKVNSTSNGK